jgi:galactose mutarotase-like enzyme
MRDTGESFGIKFHLQSSDGDSGFPGNCQIELTVILDNQNQLQMIYSAETDKATPMNLTNHTYWNLSGDCKKSALDHSLRLHCSHYTPVDDTQIPTGEIRAVKGSAFDLTTADMLGGHIDLVDGGGKPGFDHNFVADRKAHMDKDTLLVVAQLTEPESGRAMIIATTEPGLQVYTANFLDSDSTEFPHVQVKLLTLQHRPQTLMMLVAQCSVPRVPALPRQCQPAGISHNCACSRGKVLPTHRAPLSLHLVWDATNRRHVDTSQ